MIIKSTSFLKSATRPGNYPELSCPEIAFAGRSNVGKSSLLNVLIQRKSLVRTSSTPGRTQLINFFDLNGELALVDLPGYGFAKVPMAVKTQWGPMVRTYLQSRTTLAAVVMLFDVRRVPRAEDLQLLDWLEEFSIPTIPVITKIDKVTRNTRRKHIEPIIAATGLPAEAFTLFSALSKEGREEIWERLEVAVENMVEEMELEPASDLDADDLNG
ncbi:MAG: ribosome biogenesis GTP-binding protein YihA/YsxC [Desulfuromonas sp.]|nr:ribosome biogenesis GTP-binding protein YihA/YsxC [Desulfuromonas sp.]